MSTNKPVLDLDVWSRFSPPERTNDYEYNLLLYKFKSLYNEVKEFQELHKDCPSSKSTPYSGLPKLGLRSININNIRPTNSNGHPQPSTGLNRKSFLQHQNTVPPYEGVAISDINTVDMGGSIKLDHPNYRPTSNPQHFSSSYNLTTPSSSNNNTNNAHLIRPEIKQRIQVFKNKNNNNNNINNRLSLSKSIERLDSGDDNLLPSNIKPNNIVPFTSTNFSQSKINDKYLQEDSNIYDAVSPDDIPNTSFTTAYSTNNLSRMSLARDKSLDLANSSLGLVSSSMDISSASTKDTPKTASSGKNTSNGNSNDSERNISFGSSIILDNTNNSSSSLSQISGLPSRDNNHTIDRNESPHYANYVNIDFFLKRSNSPSFDGLEEDPTNDVSSYGSDEDDTTQMSNSLSSDQIYDDDVLECMLPSNQSGQAYNSSSKVNDIESSTSSLARKQTRDFMNDASRREMPMTTRQQSPPSTATRQHEEVNKSLTSHNRGDGILNTDLGLSNPSILSTNQIQSLNQDSGVMLAAKQGISLNPGKTDQNGNALVEAHNTMRSFLSELNLSSIEDVFEDKAQRRIVKESFAVEFCGRRKLRHLFLFNDVIVCAKYQASSKQKFTFDVKWYLNLNGVSVVDLNDASNHLKFDKEAMENQILSIRTSLMLLRGQIQHVKRSKHKQPSKIIKKLKKKRTELEAELVLLLPHLPLVIKHTNGKKYTFFLSSNFDRNQWIESIKFLQSQLPASKSSASSPSSNELQAWIQTCRKNLNPSLGTFLLRSNCDDDLLYGDFCINLNDIRGITRPGNYYLCFEVDSYGHFSKKASSAVLRIENPEHILNEEYLFPLDGANTLRVLLYEDLGCNVKPSVIGKAHIELSRSWFHDKSVEKVILFNSTCSLTTRLSFVSSELLSMRIPHAKVCPTFGMDITQVCKKEKTNVPLLIQLCINEVERRGMREVGIYRMSGTSTDIQKLKKAYETNPYVAELLLRDIDINSVTGFLKTYLREMPEGLFSNKLYLKFVAVFNIPQSESHERARKMLELFHKIPITNQHTIIYLVEHLVKVNKYENYNKMSLSNLATVLGPNILRPPTDLPGTMQDDQFNAVVIGSMSQAGILYFFLNRKFTNLPLTELDPSELTR